MSADRRPGVPARPVTCFLVAAEHSGDHLGATLMRALRVRYGARIRFDGIGGAEMAAEGLRSLFPIGDLAIIGVMAIPSRLPVFMRHIREAAGAVLAARPDVLVIIDSPDFTHRVARRVRARDPGIPIIDYVSPSVWIWRPWRARAMRRYVDRVLAILPFEPDVHARLNGPPCSYVGHPLSERAGALRPDAGEARRREADPPLILILPGSRGGELRRLLPVFAATVARLRASLPAMDLVIPIKPSLAETVRSAVAGWAVAPRIVTGQAEKDAAFRAARAALTKSGTVTLELAVAGIPMVAAYKVPAVEAFLARRLLRVPAAARHVVVPSVILANLVLGEKVVPEFLQEDCTPENLAGALAAIVREGPGRRRQTEAFERLDAIMEIGGADPSVRAADVVAEFVERRAAVAAR